MKKLRVAIVGLGNITHGYEDNPNVVKRMKYPTHLSVLKKDKRFVVVAGSDPSATAQQAFVKKAGKTVVVYSDHRAMIKTVKPDLLVVAAPTALHVKICEEAIGLGVKNILCEKPIAYDLKQAEYLVKLAKRKKVKLIFNYFRNFEPSYQKLIKKIQAKTWGPLRQVQINYTGGVYNMASHLLVLVEKMIGPLTKVVQQSTWSYSQESDPTITFVAKAGSIPIICRGLSNTKYRLFELELCFESGRVTVNSDVLEAWQTVIDHGFTSLQPARSGITINLDRSFFHVYNNVYKHITAGQALDSTPDQALHALTVIKKALS